MGALKELCDAACPAVQGQLSLFRRDTQHWRGTSGEEYRYTAPPPTPVEPARYERF